MRLFKVLKKLMSRMKIVLMPLALLRVLFDFTKRSESSGSQICAPSLGNSTEEKSHPKDTTKSRQLFTNKCVFIFQINLTREGGNSK